MARPNKSGLNYFPLDVDIDQDDKIALIEAKHGLIGFGLIIKIFMKIYKEGYYYKWTEKEQLLLSSRVNVDINLVNVIINDCIKWELFDQEIFDKYGVLTSKGIQTRYIEAIGRRKEVSFQKEYLLIDVLKQIGTSKITVSVVSDNKNGVNVDIKPIPSLVNADIGTQSKVKEIESKAIKDYTSQIKHLLARYPKEFSELNSAYWNLIRETRASKKIQDSVIYKSMEKWSDHPVNVVEFSLKRHLEIGSDKDEKYTIGIMRKTTNEEAIDKLERMKPKGVIKYETNVYDNLF